MAVAVVTDTTHYMPGEVVESAGIHLVPLYVNWPDGRTARETELPGFQPFYDELITAKDLPTTSQPSVGDFLAVYEPLLERGDDILSIHLSGTLSGTVESAEQARAHLVDQGIDPGRIAVMDSTTGCAGHGEVALAAASAARAGASVEEALAAARRCREGVVIIFAVDTLEYLRRGGRIGAASAYLGTALKVKPILTFDGTLRPVTRVRTSSRAVEHLAGHLAERREQGCDAFVVQHVQAPEQAARMADRGREIFGADAEYISEIGPVVGTHVGPGLIGVSAYERALVEAPAG
ncbi:MAG: DegV family protein [uncultured Solirubrobacteraceae bacterium]|uniref:DegV family protein n=1 Tax=uncultured Solirubrobacteraceae bacterium TaxID=1162706 RepID=A0A6J4SKH8_9ACTN|nr:MAG: DegV family protein [uncultured Solirubrobacteraceae bacterium]